MNTEQNYVGGGNYANSIEQRANNDSQTASMTYSQNEAYANLFLTVNSFLSSVESKKTVFALQTVLEHWIQTEYKQHIRDGASDEDMVLWDTIVSNVFNTISLVDKLDKDVEEIYLLSQKQKNQNE